MLYKLKIIEFYYTSEEDLDNRLNFEIQEIQKLGWVVLIKQILEHRIVLDGSEFIKIVLELN
jgi:hypothetical protein